MKNHRWKIRRKENLSEHFLTDSSVLILTLIGDKYVSTRRNYVGISWLLNKSRQQIGFSRLAGRPVKPRVTHRTLCDLDQLDIDPKRCDLDRDLFNNPLPVDIIGLIENQCSIRACRTRWSAPRPWCTCNSIYGLDSLLLVYYNRTMDIDISAQYKFANSYWKALVAV